MMNKLVKDGIFFIFVLAVLISASSCQKDTPKENKPSPGKQAASELSPEKQKQLDDLIRLGNDLSRENKQDEAMKAFNDALAMDSGNSMVYMCRGLLYMRKNDVNNALADYDRAIQLSPDMGIAYTNRGDAYFQIKEYKKALEDYEKALKLNPNDRPAVFNRARAFMELKDYRSAIKEMNRAIKLAKSSGDKEAWMLYSQRGRIHRETGDMEAAMKDYQAAQKLNPAYFEGFVEVGRNCLEKKDYKNAVKYFVLAQKALEMAEKTPKRQDRGDLESIDEELQNNLLIACLKSGDIEQAVKNYPGGVSFKGKNADLLKKADLYNRYANAMEDEREKQAALYKKAVKLIDDYLKSGGDAPAAYLIRGIAELKFITAAGEDPKVEIKYYTDAINDLDKYTSMGGDNREAYRWRGRALVRRSQRSKGNEEHVLRAVKDIDKYLDMGGKDIDVYMFRGQAQYYRVMQSGQEHSKEEEEKIVRDAVKNLDEYIERGGEDISAYRYRGFINQAKLDMEQGREDLKKYADNYEPASAVDAEDLGRVLMKVGEYEKAIKFLTKALKMDPDRPYSYYDRAEARFKLEEYEDAREDYKKYLVLIKDNPNLDKEEIHAKLKEIEKRLKERQ